MFYLYIYIYIQVISYIFIYGILHHESTTLIIKYLKDTPQAKPNFTRTCSWHTYKYDVSDIIVVDMFG